MGKCFKCDKLCNKKTEKYQSCRYKKVISHSDEANARYEESCNMLAQAFACKHEYNFDGWIGYFNPDTYSWNRYAGGLAVLGDRVVSLEDIRVDLMEDAPVGAYEQYEEETVRYLSDNDEKQPCINYYNWLRGARNDSHKSSQEWKKSETEKLDHLKEKVAESEERLKEIMKNFR